MALKPPFRWTVLVAFLAVLLSLGLGGCDFLAFSPFPPWLGWVRAEHDLRDVLPDEIGHVEARAVIDQDSGRRYFSLVFVGNNGETPVLALLDDTFRILVLEEEQSSVVFDSSPFVTIPGAGGNPVQIGSVIYDPDTDSVTNTGTKPDGRFDPIIIEPINGEYLFVSKDGSGNVVFERADSVFGTLGQYTGPFFDTLSSPEQFTVHGIPSAGGVAWEYALFVNGEGRTWYRALAIADITTPPAQYLDTTLNTTQFLDAYLNLDDIRMTPEGILTREERDGEDVLVRYDTSTGTVVDEFSLGDETGDRYWVLFDPAGAFYLLFDKQRGMLYEMEVWW